MASSWNRSRTSVIVGVLLVCSLVAAVTFAVRQDWFSATGTDAPAPDGPAAREEYAAVYTASGAIGAYGFPVGEFGVIQGDELIFRLGSGSFSSLSWTADGRIAFAVSSAGQLTFVDVSTAAGSGLPCGCNEALPYGSSGAIWLSPDGVHRIDFATGEIVDDNRTVPAAPEPRGRSALLATAGPDLLVAQTVRLGAQLGADRIIRVTPEGKMTVIADEVNAVDGYRSNRAGRIAFVGNRPLYCPDNQLIVVEPDGRRTSVPMDVVRGSAGEAANVTIHDLWWDAQGRLRLTASATVCNAQGADVVTPATQWQLEGDLLVALPGPEDALVVRTVDADTGYYIDQNEQLVVAASGETVARGVEQVQLSPRPQPVAVAPTDEVSPGLVSPGGVGAIRLGEPVEPLVTDGLLVPQDGDYSCPSWRGIGQYDAMSVLADRDLFPQRVTQIWIAEQGPVTASGLGVGDTGAEVRAHYGIWAQPLPADLGQVHLMVGRGTRGVLFVMLDDTVDKMVVGDLSQLQATVAATEAVC